MVLRSILGGLQVAAFGPSRSFANDSFVALRCVT